MFWLNSNTLHYYSKPNGFCNLLSISHLPPPRHASSPLQVTLHAAFYQGKIQKLRKNTNFILNYKIKFLNFDVFFLFLHFSESFIRFIGDVWVVDISAKDSINKRLGTEVSNTGGKGGFRNTAKYGRDSR